MKVLVVLREQRFELYACYLYLPYGIPPTRCFSSLSIPKIFLPSHFVAIDFPPACEKKIYDIYTISLLEIPPISSHPLSPCCKSASESYNFRILSSKWSPSVAYETTNCASLNFHIFNIFFFNIFIHFYFIHLSKTSWFFYTDNGNMIIFLSV